MSVQRSDAGDSLPETFETFASTRVCSDCGDRVAERHFVDDADECVGCHWGDR